MKKLIVMILILLFGVVGVMGYYFINNKLHQEKEIIKYNENKLDIIDNKVNSKIVIDDIQIYNIEIVDNKYLDFIITSKKTDIKNKRLEIIMYNENTVNAGAVKDILIKDFLTKNNKVRVDIAEDYNNPSSIELNIK